LHSFGIFARFFLYFDLLKEWPTMPLRGSSTAVWRRPSLWKLLWKLPSLIRLVRRLLLDSRVPIAGKLVFGLCVAYVLWPIDLIPDFVLPVLGQIDDVAVLLGGVKFLLNQTSPAVLEEHLENIS
jgi:uncharacterized membrane protein YkvA (DUF1232 family)